MLFWSIRMRALRLQFEEPPGKGESLRESEMDRAIEQSGVQMAIPDVGSENDALGSGSVDASMAPEPSRLRLHVLASGSKGNCSLIEDTATGECIAVDCGVSWKAFRERSADCGVDPTRVTAFLMTHEHSDHTKGLGVVTRGLARLGAHPALYASRAVHEASRDIRAIEETVDLRHFSRGDELRFGEVSAYAFHTSHDAAESFGFRFTCDGFALGFMTDTGMVTGEAEEALRDSTALALESNYDPTMLANGPYPAYLKARISSRRGHLSNVQSAELLERLLCNRLEWVVGMHVSQNNNEYRIPRTTLGSVLEHSGHPARASVGYQDRPISL